MIGINKLNIKNDSYIVYEEINYLSNNLKKYIERQKRYKLYNISKSFYIQKKYKEIYQFHFSSRDIFTFKIIGEMRESNKITIIDVNVIYLGVNNWIMALFYLAVFFIGLFLLTLYSSIPTLFIFIGIYLPIASGHHIYQNISIPIKIVGDFLENGNIRYEKI